MNRQVNANETRARARCNDEQEQKVGAYRELKLCAMRREHFELKNALERRGELLRNRSEVPQSGHRQERTDVAL